jgi:hypothetical protein
MPTDPRGRLLGGAGPGNPHRLADPPGLQARAGDSASSPKKSGGALKKEKSHCRKLTLPDSLFDRLQLYAIKKQMTVSAAAADVLHRNLPKLRIADE